MLRAHLFPHKSLRCVIVVCLVAAFVAQAQAQSGRARPKPRQQEQKDPDSLRLIAEEVLLPVSVRTDRGKLPNRLERADFIVTENDKRQQITSVMRTPANILLILDNSGEVVTAKDININRLVAMRVIESLGDDDRAAVMTYGDKVELICPWTGDKETLKQALNWKFRPRIKPHLYDAIQYAAEKVLPEVTGRRSVVLMTDGVDSFVQGGFESALESLHKIRATLYVINHAAMLIRDLKPRVFNPLAFWEMLDPAVRKKYLHLRQYVRELEAGETNLRGLSEETGGAVWNPEQRIECARTERQQGESFGKPRELDVRVDCETIRNQLIHEIGTEYVVSYSSERRSDDSKFHSIRVYSTRPDLKIRVRRGIYPGGPRPEARQPGQ
ncbi:MAG TPA: VWA domain-containing protein [Blastocatellia bacterium]|jgi:VWFA-related protein|nr:VWA domain-containing protein [Blastocatellia bacterium]